MIRAQNYEDGEYNEEDGCTDKWVLFSGCFEWGGNKIMREILAWR